MIEQIPGNALLENVISTQIYTVTSTVLSCAGRTPHGRAWASQGAMAPVGSSRRQVSRTKKH